LIDVGSAVARHLEEKLGLGPFEALERADHVLDGVRNMIDRILADEYSLGIISAYSWTSPARTTLQHVGAVDELAARRLQLRDSIIAAMDILTGAEFERICDRLLGIYGVPINRRYVTQYSQDHGVDFYALTAAAPGQNRLQTQPVRIMGQAKKRSGTVAPDPVGAFCNRIQEVRAHSGPAWEQAPAWFRSADVPIIGLFVTTGHVGGESLRTASRHVVFSVQGPQVADDLAHAPEAVEWIRDDGTLDVERFRRTP